jgi:hypothetical protein
VSVGSIDDAVIATLNADATLTTLVPGRWFRDMAPQGVSKPFGIVTLMAHEDIPQLSSANEAYQVGRYLVKVVDESTTSTAAELGADRAHVVLQNASLTISGFHSMDARREERISYVEADGSSRFQHRGGIYVVMACL